MMNKRRIHYWIFDFLSTLIIMGIIIALSVMICKSYEAEAQTWTRTERQVVDWVPNN